VNNIVKRLFIAVSITDDLVNDLNLTKAKLESEISGRWVNPESIHLTLKFLGNRSSNDVTDIVAIIKKSVSNVRSFNLKTTGIGCFPNHRRARFLWLGFEEEERLLRIKREIETRMSVLGIEEDIRDYHPHLTLARLNNKRLDIKEINERIAITRELPVERVTLFESVLNRGGAKHYALDNIKLLS